MTRLGPLALAAALAGCGSSPSGGVPDAGGPPLEFAIGGLVFRVSSGTAVRTGGLLALYLTDQPDTCLAVSLVPVMTVTTFSLRVAAAADGTTRAAVVAPKPAPGAGEAVGGLVRATGGARSASLDAANGSVAWAENANGTVTITSLDVGFTGAADRLTTGGLSLPPCPP
jgi:hypothetical protein